jgi:hypothetical protein
MLRRFPSFQLLLQASPAASRFKLIKIDPLTVDATKLLDNKLKFRRHCQQAAIIYHTNVFTLILTYQKDEWALPGNHRTTCSFSPLPK